ncbi:hypothetical protein AMTR_s00061p00184540 [Amborella trichopoda]|uniref:Uncharacterized protein n=1 Tax=Amborella trichopoda TaxID=13333 RepID=U5DFK3_AMBTC|nr:hypothetical protein AMTR_s00061p00184540 [Amborella trichopoda]
MRLVIVATVAFLAFLSYKCQAQNIFVSPMLPNPRSGGFDPVPTGSNPVLGGSTPVSSGSTPVSGGGLPFTGVDNPLTGGSFPAPNGGVEILPGVVVPGVVVPLPGAGGSVGVAGVAGTPGSTAEGFSFGSGQPGTANGVIVTGP